MGKILVIDDDPMVREMIEYMVGRLGHDVDQAATLENGLQKIRTGNFDLVFLDVQLPDGSGLENLNRIQAFPHSPEVIIITGFGDPDGAELAIRSGAWDYVEKPFTFSKLSLPLTRALQYRSARDKEKSSPTFSRAGFVGSSPAINQCFEIAIQAAASDVHVLITGETGTGKELMARAIHQNSERAGKNFVVVDCAALPENIVESVLFGHEKGAFTGADRMRDGLIRQAHEGTLFLDEIGDLPLSLQRTFLRVLQERRFRPVGSAKEVASDFRLIAATHRDLEEMVQAGKFRSDLLFRLRAIVINLPPLRERPGDVRDIAVHYLSRLCERHQAEMKSFSPDFYETLISYDWPGNVRELVHAVERAFVMAHDEPVLYTKHLPDHIRVSMVRQSLRGARPETQNPASFGRFRDMRQTALNRFEHQYLSDLLDLANGDILKACQISGLSRPRLYALLSKHHVKPAKPLSQDLQS